MLIFGILQGNAKTSWMRIIPVGIIYFLLYYFIFSFLIKKFDLKTPGREDEDGGDKALHKSRCERQEVSGRGRRGRAVRHGEVEAAQTETPSAWILPEDWAEREILPPWTAAPPVSDVPWRPRLWWMRSC